MERCINQMMTIGLNEGFVSEPVGKIHGTAHIYQMISDDERDWGQVILCDECKDEHIKLGWKCVLIK